MRPTPRQRRRPWWSCRSAFGRRGRRARDDPERQVVRLGRSESMVEAKPRILLVDDEVAITSNLAPFLERAGFTVQVTTVSRTLVDVTTAGLAEEQVRQAIREALRRELVSRERLLRRATAHGGRIKRLVEETCTRESNDDLPFFDHRLSFLVDDADLRTPTNRKSRELPMPGSYRGGCMPAGSAWSNCNGRSASRPRKTNAPPCPRSRTSPWSATRKRTRPSFSGATWRPTCC
jgi:hypothetical protein